MVRGPDHNQNKGPRPAFCFFVTQIVPALACGSGGLSVLTAHLACLQLSAQLASLPRPRSRSGRSKSAATGFASDASNAASSPSAATPPGSFMTAHQSSVAAAFTLRQPAAKPQKQAKVSKEDNNLLVNVFVVAASNASNYRATVAKHLHFSLRQWLRGAVLQRVKLNIDCSGGVLHLACLLASRRPAQISSPSSSADGAGWLCAKSGAPRVPCHSPEAGV